MTDEDRAKMGLRTLTWKSPVYKTAKMGGGKLTVKSLEYKYKKHVIFENISFSASSGDIIGVLGENGTGKTSLMRCIAGLQKNTKGTICYKGKELNAKERNNLCYMIMQDVNHQLFGESVGNECELSADVNTEDIKGSLEEFDLHELREKHPMALSGGQKQRLAIVTGILAEKEVLIFDEPTSGLDYDHMCIVSKTLKDLAKKGHIILIVTHDMEFLEQTCKQVVEIDNFKSGEGQL